MNAGGIEARQPGPRPASMAEHPPHCHQEPRDGPGRHACEQGDPEVERAARGDRPMRRWILAGPGTEAESFDRRAIALRALRSAPDGTQLVDGLTGEVVTLSQDT